MGAGLYDYEITVTRKKLIKKVLKPFYIKVLELIEYL